MKFSTSQIHENTLSINALIDMMKLLLIYLKILGLYYFTLHVKLLYRHEFFLNIYIAFSVTDMQ
jgi:hypothetical protein